VPLLVEMGWGGIIQLPDTITWTDVTQRVDQARGVTIDRGASDERSETQPGTARLALDNQDGALTPGNSASPFYPYVRKLAPIRISVAVTPTRTGTAPYPLAMLGDDFDDGQVNTARWPTNVGGATETTAGRLRIPLAPGVDTNFTSVREWKLTSSQITAKLAKVPALNGSSNCAASMWITSTTAGTRIGWRYDAGTGVLAAQSQTAFADGASVNLPYSAIDHAWVRVREASGTVYWETSGDGWDWVVRRTLATPAWVGAQTHAVDFPTTRTGGTSDYIEWDLVGADVRPRFYGRVNEFPVEWEGLLSMVQITCTDLFKWLNRLPNLKSMLAQEILTQDVPGVTDFGSAYYPLTEPSGSTSAGDISGGGCGSLVLTQVSSGGTLEFGTDGLADTGDSAVSFTPASASAGKYLVADLGARFQADSTTYWQTVEFWIKTTTASRAILGMYENGLDHQLVYALNASGVLTVEYTDSGGSLTVYTSASAALNDGNWHHVVHDGYSPKQLYVDGVASSFTTFVPDMVALRTLHVGGYRGGRLFNGSIAHVAVTSVSGNIGATIAPVHYQAATTGFAGEDADVRMQRLARYAGVPSVTVWGTTHDAIASQGAGGSSVVSRMREVESTESGKLYAERDYYGLAYQSRDVRYNPDPLSEVFTIDYADLEPGTKFADDDQKMINSVEASRPGGATQRVTAPNAILAFGEYPEPLDILKTTDNAVLDAAYWLVSRYANPSPEMREVVIEAHTMAFYLDILDAEISSYFTVYNMPAQSPVSSIRATVEGYSETIKEKSHVISFHTSASATDTVWVLGDSTYGVLDYTTRLAY
jgi:hypothetical protein